MTQEEKDLLLKDLCARLPYGIKILVNDKVEIVQGVNVLDNVIEYDSCLSSEVEEVKPYLFPLSSMTEEQYKEYTDMGYSVTERWWSMANYHQIEWLNKNHFDYRGLIEKKLAINATGLSIY